MANCWNNKRESYIRTPSTEEAQKKRSILNQMRQTIAQKKKEAEEESKEELKKLTLSEIAQQEHYDLDASIAAEAQKTVNQAQPKLKGKFNSIIIPPLPETKVTEIVTKQVAEQTEEDVTFTPIKEFTDALSIVLKYFDRANIEATTLQESVHQADLETSDLLHSIELADFEMDEKSNMTDLLKDVRKRRRKDKRHLEYITEISGYVSGNKQAIQALQALKGKMRKIEEKQRNASYKPRVRIDLKYNT